MGVVPEKLSTTNNHYVSAFLKAHKMEPFFKDIGMSGRTGMVKALKSTQERIKLIVPNGAVVKPQLKQRKTINKMIKTRKN